MSIHDISDDDIVGLLNLIDAKDAPATEPEPVVALPDGPPSENLPIPEPEVDEAAVAQAIQEAETQAVESALAEVKAEEVKKSIYKKQSEKASKVKPDTTERKSPDYPDVKEFQAFEKSTKKKQRKPKAPKAPKAPKLSIDEMLKNSGFGGALTFLGFDVGSQHPVKDREIVPDDVAEMLRVKNQKQQKAILNFVAWRSGKDELFLYTRYAIEALLAFPQGITKKELHEFYMSKSVKLGQSLLRESTARSQAIKYWHVLQAVGLATSDTLPGQEDEQLVAVADMSFLSSLIA